MCNSRIPICEPARSRQGAAVIAIEPILAARSHLESLLSLVQMHWDHEPTADRFLESLLSFFRMHWDHEPRAVPRRTKSADKSDALQTLRAVRRRPAVAKRLECVRLQRRFSKASSDSMAGRFMESPHDLDAVHWDHEPVWAIQSAAGPAHSKTWRKCA